MRYNEVGSFQRKKRKKAPMKRIAKPSPVIRSTPRRHAERAHCSPEDPGPARKKLLFALLFIVLLAILLYAFPLDWLRIVYQQRVLGQKRDENEEPFLSPKGDIFYNAQWFVAVDQHGRLVLLNRDFVVRYEECRKQRIYRTSNFWYKVKIQTNCGHMRVRLSSQRSVDFLRQWIRGSIAMEPTEE